MMNSGESLMVSSSTSIPLKILAPLSQTFTINYDSDYWVKWHQVNWKLSFWFVIIYIFSILCGQRYMASRKPFILRKQLALWSASLAIFSVAGAFTMVPEMWKSLKSKGFHGSCCSNEFTSKPEIIFWSWLFVWSKVIEFGDTGFIILRRQRLSFLHWYHHSMTVICSFIYFPAGSPINLFTGSVNYTIHSLMYSYYSLKAARIVSLPRAVSILITSLQIIQMVIGFYVPGYQAYAKLNGIPCSVSLGLSVFALIVYISYFCLFINFFVKTYFKRQIKQKKVD